MPRDCPTHCPLRENLTNASLPADLPTADPQEVLLFRDLLDRDTWQLLSELRKNYFFKRNLPGGPDFPPVHKHLCSGFGEGGAVVELEAERQQDGLIPLTTGTGGGAVGIGPEQC